MSHVIVVIGAGSIGQAIARRVSAGKHILLADLRQENTEAAAEVLNNAGYEVSTATAGGPKEETHPGDIVWFAPGEKHWHGGTATTAMSHIAIAEALEGKSVDWMEHVSDQQYRA
jgi:predicted dinucleotide-binding enzyme